MKQLKNWKESDAVSNPHHAPTSLHKRLNKSNATNFLKKILKSKKKGLEVNFFETLNLCMFTNIIR